MSRYTCNFCFESCGAEETSYHHVASVFLWSIVISVKCVSSSLDEHPSSVGFHYIEPLLVASEHSNQVHHLPARTHKPPHHLWPHCCCQRIRIKENPANPTAFVEPTINSHQNQIALTGPKHRALQGIRTHSQSQSTTRMGDSETVLIGVLVPVVAVGLAVLGLFFLARQKATAGRVSIVYGQFTLFHPSWLLDLAPAQHY